MSELNLSGLLGGKAKEDFDAFSSHIRAQVFEWPNNVRLADSWKDASSAVRVLLQENGNEIPILWKWKDDLRMDYYTNWRINWNFHVSPDGSAIASPVLFDVWIPEREEKRRIEELAKSIGAKTTTQQLKEPLFPFLPDLAVRKSIQQPYWEHKTGYSAWSYASDVRAFRAALMDELHKPL